MCTWIVIKSVVLLVGGSRSFASNCVWEYALQKLLDQVNVGHDHSAAAVPLASDLIECVAGCPKRISNTSAGLEKGHQPTRRCGPRQEA